MNKFTLIAALFLLSGFAHAENIGCLGTGRFETISQSVFELNWTDKSQQVLEDTPTSRVVAEIYRQDATRETSPAFLKITVIKITLKPKRDVFLTSAAGSLKDLVDYAESGSDGVASTIVCSRAN